MVAHGETVGLQNKRFQLRQERNLCSTHATRHRKLRRSGIFPDYFAPDGAWFIFHSNSTQMPRLRRSKMPMLDLKNVR
jgi:hypothetical protein